MNALFNILNLVLAAGIIYVGVQTFVPGKEGNLAPGNTALHPVGNEALNPASSAGTDKNSAARFQGITKRNLFQVAVEKKSEPVKKPVKETNVEKLEPTKLKLELWGTVAVGPVFYAVIEDKTSRKQELYEIGDKVSEATVEKIHAKKVILTYKGRMQVLEMNETPNPRKKVSQFAVGKARPVSSAMPKESLEPGENVSKKGSAEKGTKRSAVKFRPHTSQGEVDGMMVYGIRPNSMFRKYGIRNGDVIQTINDELVASEDAARALFSDPESLEGATITLVRRGQVKEIQARSQGNESETLRGEN